MKIRTYLALSAAALLMSNCSQEETPNRVQGGTNTLTAIIENGSRSAVTDGGVFSWTPGDKISVYNGTDFTEFTLSSGNVFSSNETITPSGVAIYPASTEHDFDGTTTKVNLATEYNYGSTNAPMIAEVTNTTLAFKHVGGLMRFVVKGVPSTATDFTFTANSGITGSFEVTEDSDEEKVISTAATTGADKTVTISFTPTDIKDVMTFYVPLPTGTYGGYTVSVGGKSHTTETTVTNTINRGTLLLMPTFTYDENETSLVKGEDNMVVMNSGEEVNMSVADNEVVTVNVAQGATATLNLTAPENTTDGTVTITDGSAEDTESATSTGTLNVKADNVSTLNINAPTLTVNLTSGTYDKVEALTATNTLIIGEGVTIGELVVKGGNVKLEGNATLSAPLVVNQDMTLDLGSKTLTATKSGIIVKNGTFTIKNGTLSAVNTGSDAISIQGETDATIVVNVESSASLTAGDCCIVVPNSNQSTNITVNTAGVLEAQGTYNAIQLNGNATSANLNVTGGKIVSTGDDTAGIYYPCNGTLTISAGEITGATAVYVKSGNLNITGGALVGNGTKKEYQYWGNGCHTTGEALVIDNCNYPYELGTLSISGGTFSSTNANAVGSYYGNDATEAKTGFITGGTFSDPSACYYLGTNANVTVNMEENYEGAGFKTTNGQTVALTIASGKTYTVITPLVGSAGTQTLGFQFKQGSTVTIAGSGTITSAEAKMLINNYADLTLKGVTLAPSIPTTMNGQTYYVLSNNCGTVNIEGGTTITAPTSSDTNNCPTVYAFDVCKYASYPNVTVNIKDATITGNVEYTGAGIDQKLNISGGTITGDLVVADTYKTGALAGGVSITSGTQTGSNWSSYEAIDSAKIIGKWLSISRTYIFDANGTFDSPEYDGVEFVDEKWYVVGRILVLEQTADEDDPEGCYITSITDTEIKGYPIYYIEGVCTISFEDGESTYLTRVTE